MGRYHNISIKVIKIKNISDCLNQEQDVKRYLSNDVSLFSENVKGHTTVNVLHIEKNFKVYPRIQNNYIEVKIHQDKTFWNSQLILPNP